VRLGSVNHVTYSWKALIKRRVILGLVCSQTQLCHIGVFNDYIKQLHVSAFTGHLQVVLREQT